MKTTLIDYDRRYKIHQSKEHLFRLEAHDGMHLVDMFWSSDLEVRMFIQKYNVPMINLFQVGDKVNYLPKLSGLKNPLTVKSFRWNTECSLHTMLDCPYEPCYIYYFEENSLASNEEDLEIYKRK